MTRSTRPQTGYWYCSHIRVNECFTKITRDHCLERSARTSHQRDQRTPEPEAVTPIEATDRTLLRSRKVEHSLSLSEDAKRLSFYTLL